MLVSDGFGTALNMVVQNLANAISLRFVLPVAAGSAKSNLPLYSTAMNMMENNFRCAIDIES